MVALYSLKPYHGGRKKRRIGRGGKRGTFSGRGTKGQRARAGAKIRPSERDILKKVPKLRGYKFKVFRSLPQVVNMRDLNRVFKDGEIVSPDTLLHYGLVRRIKGRVPSVKILGKYALHRKLTFKGVLFSKSAKPNS